MGKFEDVIEVLATMKTTLGCSRTEREALDVAVNELEKLNEMEVIKNDPNIHYERCSN